MMVPDGMRYFSRDIVNRLTLRSAGTRYSQFAVVRHVGRRSGKLYETPLLLVPLEKDFVIALTYGPEVDWYRNLQAAGQGTLLKGGKTYAIDKVELIDRVQALPAFPPLHQAILRLLHAHYFARMTLIPPDSA